MAGEQAFISRAIPSAGGPARPFEIVYLDDGTEQRCGLSEAWDVPFEGVHRVRDFPAYKGQRNNAGLWWSATMQAHVGHESWFERDHLMMLDFDPTVTGIASQPFWLFWDHEGRQRSHAPDYFARTSAGKGIVIDCKGYRWAIHYDPYDLRQVWLRTSDSWVTVPWTHLPMVNAPFADFTWRHARELTAARGQDPANETAVAEALNDLLHKLIKRHGTASVEEAALQASGIVRRWCERGNYREHRDRRITQLGEHGQVIDWDNPAFEAACYHEVLSLTEVLVSPGRPPHRLPRLRALRRLRPLQPMAPRADPQPPAQGGHRSRPADRARSPIGHLTRADGIQQIAGTLFAPERSTQPAEPQLRHAPLAQVQWDGTTSAGSELMSVTSPTTTSALSGSSAALALLRTSARTRCPPPRASATTRRPMLPVAPTTRTVRGLSDMTSPRVGQPAGHARCLA